MHEKQMYENNSFITLTYNEEKIPQGKSLAYSDYQGFMKRLLQHAKREYWRTIRKDSVRIKPRTGLPTKSRREIRFGQSNAIKKILDQQNAPRFYMCGEYGERTQRPHYHAIIFGYDFPDKKFFAKTKTGETLYTSEILKKLWGKGHTTTGEVTFQSAAYVARYITKKITGQKAQQHYEYIDLETGEITNRTPEFNHMSLKPGIGARWLERYTADVYPEGKVLVRGHKSKSPKYYDKQYKKLKPLEYEDLQWQREKASLLRSSDNTKERLADKERVAHAKASQLKRTLE